MLHTVYTCVCGCVCISVLYSVRCVSFSQVLPKSMAQQAPAVSMAFTPVKVSSLFLSLPVLSNLSSLVSRLDFNTII